MQNRGQRLQTESFTHKRHLQPLKNDIYATPPVRYIGFTNEIGAALAPLVGPKGEMFSYIPSLCYIAMDVIDKYKRGDDDTSQKTSVSKGVEQLTFQAFASVLLPTATIKMAQGVANKVINDVIPTTAKDSVKTWIKNIKPLNTFITKFADKSQDASKSNALLKFAKKFTHIIEKATIVPMILEPLKNKSGLRNLTLAAVGLSTLACVIKPIDKFTEHVIIGKVVKPLLGDDKLKQV